MGAEHQNYSHVVQTSRRWQGTPNMVITTVYLFRHKGGSYLVSY